MNGRNGGQGFSAAWQATSEIVVTSPGLTYGGLQTSARTSAYMDARIGGTRLAFTDVPGTNYYTGSYLVLGRITFSDTSGQDRLEVWLNPPLTGTPGTPLFNVTGTWVDPGVNNSFYMNKYDPPDRSIAEIRLGTTLADVTPVPEPAALGLLAPAALAGWWFGRRRH